jgi:histidine triad (HIT) family protein
MNNKEKNMASVFSQIIAGEIPSYKIYEDEKTYAFLDINPEVKGHTLVVPKVEVDRIYDLSDEDWNALWASVKKIAKHMEEVTGRRTVMKVVGTDVPHAHVHLTPIDETWEYGKTLQLKDEEFEEICQKLAF